VVVTSRRAAVLGHPIAHSLSPVLHEAAYRALGLERWRYTAEDVTEEGLVRFLAGLDAGWAGLSLTMPLKQAVLPLLDHVEPMAEVVGAVNTVLVQPERGGYSLVGANTDVHGVAAALREGLAGRIPVTGAVLGGGATAASSLAALAELGITDALVYVRSLGRSGALVRAAHRMGVAPQFRGYDRAHDELAGADVVVATLPPHEADELAGTLPGTLRGVLLDVAYEPRPTALGAAWAAAGGTVVGGERMLLHQAAEQVRLMTGRPAPLEEMAGALEAALAAR
jgi:shikimate dehydrogenase